MCIPSSWLGSASTAHCASPKHAACRRGGDDNWRRTRDAIGEELRARGFNAAKGGYTRSYGSDDFDASVLVLPLLGVEPPDSARVRDTIDAIARELSAGSPLLYRYPPGHDGLAGTEGAFLPCAFWLVQALATTGRISEATDRLAALVEFASPLGLFAEEIDPVYRRPSRQLSASAHPRGPHSGRTGHP